MFDTSMSNDYKYWNWLLNPPNVKNFWLAISQNAHFKDSDRVVFFDPALKLTKKKENGWFYQWATTFPEEPNVPQPIKDILWEAALNDENYDSLLEEFYNITTRDKELAND